MKVLIDGWAWLRLDEMSRVQRDWLTKEMTMIQRVSPEYASRKENPAIVRCYVEDEKNGVLGIARDFFFQFGKRDHEVEYRVVDGDRWPNRLEVKPGEDGKLPAWAEFVSEDPGLLTFVDTTPDDKGPPRLVKLSEEQTQAMTVSMSHLNFRPSNGGIIQCPTGWGKTIFCLALVRELRLKTLVLVHRTFLANQWKKRIAQFLPDAKIGFIRGDEFDIEDKHIVIGMVETFASWVKNGKVPEGVADRFGMVVSDEVHRASAPTWAPVIPLFRAKKRFGVSARPKRSDGLDKCFYYHIGPKIFTGNELRLTPKVRRVWTTFKIFHSPKLNPDMLSKESMLRFMCKNAIYNQQVAEQIVLALNAGRKVLVFSDIVEHLRRLHEEVGSQWKGSSIKMDYFIGGMSEEELDEASLANVIFATYKMAAEGMDIPPIDTVVLSTPIRNPEQAAGRALRPYPGKKDPIVVDMRADAVSICRDYAESRDKNYERLYGAR